MEQTQTFKDIFISYGRKESKFFATKLFNKFSENGLEAWFDQVNIPKGDDFQLRINNGIESAHTFIFVIAPHSLQSEYCRKEIELAVKLNKRIVPLLHIEPSPNDIAWSSMHPTISKLNWIYTREELGNYNQQDKWVTIDEFEFAFEQILSLLKKDIEYVKQHTLLLSRALKWKRKQKSVRYLLVGKEREEAETWLNKEFKPPSQPPCQPSDIHCEFICQSRKNAENMMTDVFISYANENNDVRIAVNNSLARNLITTWTHEKDIEKGAQFETAIQEGIEQADNLIFFISKESINSNYCNKELAYACKLNKRIIPLLIEEIEVKKFPKEIQNLQYIDFTDNKNYKDFKKDIDDLLRELIKDKDYFFKHKQFITQAIKWESQKRNQSILLRGFNLEEAKTWLKLGESRNTYTPTNLHKQYINESIAKIGQLGTEVFISYSRNDGDFARRLNNELQFQGKTTWFDQESIAAAAANFEEEIFKGIDSSDNFLFILSPHAVASDFCIQEVNYASLMNKRFIVLFYRDTPNDQIPKEIEKIQWIDFARKDFQISFSELIRALDIDREYVQAHTKWSQKALDWSIGGHTNDLLLRGKELSNAKQWLKISVKENKQPLPTDDQKQLVNASKKLAFQTKLRYTFGLIVFSIISLLSFLAYWQRDVALKALKNAEQAELRAIKQKDKALIAKKEADSLKIIAQNNTAVLQSKQDTLNETLINLDKVLNRVSWQKRKAEQAKSETEIAKEQVEAVALAFKSRAVFKSDPTKGIRLAQAAYGLVPGYPPHDAISALYDAFYNAISEKKAFYSFHLKSHTDIIKHFAFSSGGNEVFTASKDNSIKIWDTSSGKLIKSLKKQNGSILKITVSPDDKFVASATGNNAIYLMNKRGKVISILKKHKEDISDLCFSPDSKKLISGSIDGVICIWDVTNTKLIKKIKKHSEAINDLHFSSDGKKFISASKDHKALIWSESGEMLSSLDKHKGSVNSVQYSFDDAFILTSSDDKTSKLWDAKEGILIASFEESKSILKDTKALNAIFSNNGEKVVVSYEDGIIKIWDISNINKGFRNKVLSNLPVTRTIEKFIKRPEPVATLKGHTDDVILLKFSPDGRKLLSVSRDHTARVWNINGELIGILIGHTKPLTYGSFSPDGNSVVTVSEDKTAIIWDMNSKLPSLQTLNDDFVNHASFSRNSNKLLITHDNNIKLLSSNNTINNNLISYSYKSLNELLYSNTILSSHYSANENKIISCLANNTALIWEKDSISYSPSQILKGHNNQIHYSTFSPDNRYVLTASSDSSIIIRTKLFGNKFDSVGYSIKTSSNCFFANFSPDSKAILTASQDTAFIYTIPGKYRKAKKIAELHGHTGTIYFANFSPDGNRIVTVASDEDVILWKKEENSNNYVIINRMEGHTDNIFYAAFSPDGNSIITASHDKTARIWGKNGSLITVLKGHGEKLQSALFSPDNKLIISASIKEVKVWMTDQAISEWLENVSIYNFTREDKIIFGID